MRCLAVLTAVAASLLLSAPVSATAVPESATPVPAPAKLVVQIDKSTQRMTVEVDGEAKHTWVVSTGRGTNSTPNGTYRPQWLSRNHFSRKYYNAPMPHAVFFHKGWAIHGTIHISRLGGPASHGCIRLHPNNAKILFGLVQAKGMANTQIVIAGSNPVPKGPLVAKRTTPKKPGKPERQPTMLDWDRITQRWDRS